MSAEKAERPERAPSRRPLSPAAMCSLCAVFLLLETMVSAAVLAAEPSGPTLRALAIGVQHYADQSIPRFEGAIDGGRDVLTSLERQRNRLFGAVETMGVFDAEATREGILDAIRTAFARATRGDLCVLYLAAHAVSDPVTGARYLLVWDSDLTRIEASSLPQRTLVAQLEVAVPSSARLLLLADTSRQPEGAPFTASHRGIERGYPWNELARLEQVTRQEHFGWLQVTIGPAMRAEQTCTARGERDGKQTGDRRCLKGSLAQALVRLWGPPETNPLAATDDDALLTVRELKAGLEQVAMEDAWRHRPGFSGGLMGQALLWLPVNGERCNRIDDDGDGTVDEGFDLDRDGFLSRARCGNPFGDDEDDHDARAHPARARAPVLDPVDRDGDGFPEGAREEGGDCDDRDARTWPGAPELTCDGIDHNCDGKVCLQDCKQERWFRDTTYTLSRDLLDVEDDCFVIDEEGVTLDGGGHTVSSARRMDVLYKARKEGGLQLLLNRSQGGTSRWESGWSWLERADFRDPGSASDLDGDGDLDLVIGRYRDRDVKGASLWVFENLGGGDLGTGPVAAYTDAAMGLRQQTVLDLDLDGVPDVFASSDGGMEVFFRGNLMDRGLVAAQSIDVGTFSHRIVPIDLNADGRLDLVIGSNNFRSIMGGPKVVLNHTTPRGTGGFEQVTLAQKGYGHNEVLVGDLNGDQRWDLVTHTAVVEPWEYCSRVLLGQARPDFFTDQVFEIHNSTPAQLTDLDGDGDADFLVFHVHKQANAWDSVQVYLNDGQAHFRIKGTLSGGGMTENLLSVRSLDADDLPDLVLPDVHRGLVVYQNRGGGSLVEHWSLERPVTHAHFVVRDYDNDGDADIFADLVIPGGGQLIYLTNDGRGRFAEAWHQNLDPGDDPLLLAVGDFDGPPASAIRVQASRVSIQDFGMLRGFSTGVEVRGFEAAPLYGVNVSSVKVENAELFGVRLGYVRGANIRGVRTSLNSGVGVGAFHAEGLHLEENRLCPAALGGASVFQPDVLSTWCVDSGPLTGVGNRVRLNNGCAGLGWTPCR